jgi:hypothetical protein
MAQVDDYIPAVLMRDLVGHDKRPAAFLVYLWIEVEQVRRGGAVKISYRELSESIGISKSSAQSAAAWLVKRRLLTVSKETVTATPEYTAHHPWRKPGRSSGGWPSL